MALMLVGFLKMHIFNSFISENTSMLANIFANIYLFQTVIWQLNKVTPLI